MAPHVAASFDVIGGRTSLRLNESALTSCSYLAPAIRFLLPIFDLGVHWPNAVAPIMVATRSDTLNRKMVRVRWGFSNLTSRVLMVCILRWIAVQESGL
jgi:hypothetical protein